MNFKKMKIEDIIDYCKKNNEVAWLKEEVKKVNKKNGERVRFFEIKLAFCEKFMPEIVPVAKPKKKNMYEIIDEL